MANLLCLPAEVQLQAYQLLTKSDLHALALVHTAITPLANDVLWCKVVLLDLTTYNTTRSPPLSALEKKFKGTRVLSIYCPGGVDRNTPHLLLANLEELVTIFSKSHLHTLTFAAQSTLCGEGWMYVRNLLKAMSSMRRILLPPWALSLRDFTTADDWSDNGERMDGDIYIEEIDLSGQTLRELAFMRDSDCPLARDIFNKDLWAHDQSIETSTTHQGGAEADEAHTTYSVALFGDASAVRNTPVNRLLQQLDPKHAINVVSLTLVNMTGSALVDKLRCTDLRYLRMYDCRLVGRMCNTILGTCAKLEELHVVSVNRPMSQDIISRAMSAQENLKEAIIFAPRCMISQPCWLINKFGASLRRVTLVLGHEKDYILPREVSGLLQYSPYIEAIGLSIYCVGDAFAGLHFSRTAKHIIAEYASKLAAAKHLRQALFFVTPPQSHQAHMHYSSMEDPYRPFAELVVEKLVEAGCHLNAIGFVERQQSYDDFRFYDSESLPKPRTYGLAGGTFVTAKESQKKLSSILAGVYYKDPRQYCDSIGKLFED
ncbi:hypothetical protein BDV96DRAFT_649050 [Lophiotrema nucula]|uniref:F-box domain-containing protein n=1 Tax=Lophiotrema nucula TaxID=690887 RepID=A0A6A5YZK9_9PLEO|nr:hypothetical protein BDV96DRAFT_649050 [Lophiotrema nucula]